MYSKAPLGKPSAVPIDSSKRQPRGPFKQQSDVRCTSTSAVGRLLVQKLVLTTRVVARFASGSCCRPSEEIRGTHQPKLCFQAFLAPCAVNGDLALTIGRCFIALGGVGGYGSNGRVRLSSAQLFRFGLHWEFRRRCVFRPSWGFQGPIYHSHPGIRLVFFETIRRCYVENYEF